MSNRIEDVHNTIGELWHSHGGCYKSMAYEYIGHILRSSYLSDEVVFKSGTYDDVEWNLFWINDDDIEASLTLMVRNRRLMDKGEMDINSSSGSSYRNGTGNQSGAGGEGSFESKKGLKLGFSLSSESSSSSDFSQSSEHSTTARFKVVRYEADVVFDVKVIASGNFSIDGRSRITPIVGKIIYTVIDYYEYESQLLAK